MTEPIERRARELSVWVRFCRRCGEPDLHAFWPDADLVYEPGWRCGGCHSQDMGARLVAMPADFDGGCPFR